MAEYYRSVDDADAYFAELLFATDWAGASDADKLKALKMASTSIDQLKYKGVKNTVYDALVAAGADVTKTVEYNLARTTLTELEIQAADESQSQQWPRDGEANAQSWTVTETGSPTGGTFTLTLNGETTGGIAQGSLGSAVQAALESLASISSGDVTVTGSAGGPYTVTMGSSWTPANGNTLTADGSSLTGGTSPDVTVVVVNDNIPDLVAYAVFEEARELLTGRDPQQENRNLTLNSDGVMSNRVGYDRNGPSPGHTKHMLVSPRAWQYLVPYLDPSAGSFGIDY